MSRLERLRRWIMRPWHLLVVELRDEFVFGEGDGWYPLRDRPQWFVAEEAARPAHADPMRERVRMAAIAEFRAREQMRRREADDMVERAHG